MTASTSKRKASKRKASAQKASAQKASAQKASAKKASAKKASKPGVAKEDLIGPAVAVVEVAVVEIDRAAVEIDQAAASAQYHSERAMAAARRMRRTKQKRKTGHIVCHHLRMMLTSEPGNQVPVAAKKGFGAEQPQHQLGF